MFKQRVQQFIDDNTLFDRNDKVLVALSGGADSVALFRVLLALGYNCECARCNFHLRGEESDHDEAFVRAMCQEQKVVLHVTHFDTETYAREHRQSIEMAARELRYRWFEELRQECSAKVIAVAHHRDDSVETFLLNLIRGTGINGLKGIAAKNGYIVRPLLLESRDRIEDYLDAIGQDYVTDNTNLQDVYMRNKVRLNILPMMRELNPSVAESIFETSRRLAEVADIYNNDRAKTLNNKLKKVTENEFRIRIDDILRDTAPESLLHEVLELFGFKATQKNDVMRCMKGAQSGKRFYAQEWEALRDREMLIFRHIEQADGVPELSIQEMEVESGFIVPKDKYVAYLDADKVKGELTIRRWQKGDKFVPFGMTGKKKVSDYLTDRKFSVFDKENQWVVCAGENIVWLVDERTDNRFRVTEKTRRVIVIKKDGV
jgi:tRNA(Ile)-lysidine synthase